MVYYNACSYLLGVGSIILKGNWGRGLKIKREKHSCWRREIIFENVRKKNYLNRPSRFNCNFLCTSTKDLQRFVKEYDRWFDIFYLVEPINPSASIFETNISYIPPPNETNFVFKKAAHRYWKADETIEGIKEILVDSDIRILELVEGAGIQTLTKSASLPF